MGGLFAEAAPEGGVVGAVMEMAGLVGGLAQLVSILSAFWLGGGLIRRALRGRGKPEMLLGVHLVLTMGVGSLLLTVVSVSAHADTGVSPGGLFALAITGNSVVIVGLMAALWFNTHVFHTGQRVAQLLAWVCSALMWAGFAYLVWAGGLIGENQFSTTYMPFCLAMVMTDLWVAVDALRFRVQLKKRLALGLADPIVVDRLALWGYGAVARIGLVVMTPIVNWLAPTAEQRAIVSPWLLTLSGILILTTCVAYWLMLSPTAGYRRWVERRHAAAIPFHQGA
jgi:hypothetical protein